MSAAVPFLPMSPALEGIPGGSGDVPEWNWPMELWIGTTKSPEELEVPMILKYFGHLMDESWRTMKF